MLFHSVRTQRSYTVIQAAVTVLLRTAPTQCVDVVLLHSALTYCSYITLSHSDSTTYDSDDIDNAPMCTHIGLRSALIWCSHRMFLPRVLT